MNTGQAEQKIFIHHNGALGDVLLSLPALEIIREHAGIIHLSGRPDVVHFLKAVGHVDEASDSGSMLLSSFYTEKMDDRARTFLSGFTRAFVFTKGEDALLAAQVRSIIPDTQTVITIPPAGARTHIAEFRAQQLSGGSVSPVTFEIPLPYKEKARRLLLEAGYREGERPLVVLHPGSGGRRKCWPAEHYLRLVERLGKARDLFFVILSGPAEDEGLIRVLRSFSEHRTNVVHYRNVDLAVVAALLRMSAVYIGNDSGITHLAGMVSKKVVALFGPTDPVLWKPYCKDIAIVYPDCECAPCEPRRSDGTAVPGFPECGLFCLMGISVEKVFAATAEMVCTDDVGT